MQNVEALARRILGRIRQIYDPYVERIRPYVAPTISRLRARYDRLEPREKILVQIAAAISAVFLGYNLIYTPVQNLRADLSQRTEARRHQILEVRRLVQDYERLKLELAAAEKRTVRQDKDFSLFSALQGMLTKSVGLSKIGSINPGDDRKISSDLVQHSVDITLNGVSLAEIVDALYGIETLPVPVLVSDLHIKKGGLLSPVYDVDITCVAIGKSG
jgi:hypothetical protein